MIIPRRFRPLAWTFGLLVTFVVGTWSPNVMASEQVSFKEDLFPVIRIRCLECHQPGGPGYEKSGLDLRTYEGLMKGTKFGPVVVPGQAFTSNLIAVIDGRTKRSLWMPHNRKKMTKCERLIFRFWINQGAKNN